MPRPNKNFKPKKETLAKLAFELFIQYGYEGTTITHIMQAAGLTKAGMYHYFSSKEEILDAAIDYGITRDLAEARQNMASLTVEEKMLCFIRGNAAPNEFIENMSRLKQENQNSYAAYRIRECLVHAYIPLMEEILTDGNEKGIYKAEHPRPTAEFMVLYGRALSEPHFLPAADSQAMIGRMQSFLQLMKVWLQPDEKHARDIGLLFEQIISELGKDNGGVL